MHRVLFPLSCILFNINCSNDDVTNINSLLTQTKSTEEGKSMTDNKTTIKELKDKIAKIIKDRDWEQFHSPKNLAMSIAIEAAELMEIFQWVDSDKAKDELKKRKKEVEEELADIMAYILSFCYQNDIDLSSAFERKMEINSKKYPVEKKDKKKSKDEVINDYYENKKIFNQKNKAKS